MLNSFFNIGTHVTEVEDEKPLECNYDTDLITLYQALEEQAWIPALDLIETESQESRDQVRTWVTRYETNGSVRWSQLPIHAAMIFKAPFKIVEALVLAYPKGVRCTDDQHMLPLHLAFRYGAPDNTLLLLLEAFPEAMNAKNHKGRVPALCACPESPYRSKIVRYHIDNAKQLLLEDRPMAKQVTELEGKLEEQTKETEELEAEKEAWTAREAELKEEISKLEEKLVAKKEAELKQKISELEETLAAKREVELKQEISKLEEKLAAKKEVKEETREESVSVETILAPLLDTDNDSKSVKSTSGAFEKTSTSKATAKSATSVKSAATESNKSSKSIRSLGSKLFHLGRKSSSKEVKVNPAGE